MADDAAAPAEADVAPHDALELLLNQSKATDGDMSDLHPLEEDSILDDDDDAAEAARREELRKLWDKSAPNLEEIPIVNVEPVSLSDSEILARAVCTPDVSSLHVQRPESSANATGGAVLDAAVLARRYRAQRTICRVWRRYSHIRVFTYFKQLIGFKNHGHPVALLRCVSPQEAALVADPSSGMFVRFRLAGEKFPPLIVYKLFTSVPVQDIGAFAPRDYTKVKSVPASQLHNYQASGYIPKTYDKEGWYSRVENNNWRSIAFNMLPKAADVEREEDKPCEKGREWHYSRLQRWQDREKRQRNRRIEWMQKLYRAARLENDAAQSSGLVHRHPHAPPATGAGVGGGGGGGGGGGENMPLSDHNLPMRAAASASGDDLQSIEWLMRAKSLKAVGNGMEGSSMKQGYSSSLGKPFTADGGETDTAFEEDDLIAWAT